MVKKLALTLRLLRTPYPQSGESGARPRNPCESLCQMNDTQYMEDMTGGSGTSKVNRAR